MNNCTIFQTEEETKLAIAVHQNAQIGNVRLVRAKVTAEHPDNALKEPINVSMGVKAKQVECASGQLLVEVYFRMAGSSKADQSKTKTVICVECTFEASYHLTADFTPTIEQIRAFKEGNAIFNCWPYCRQFVQEMIQRMGYPPLVIPFLRVQTKHRESRKQSKLE